MATPRARSAKPTPKMEKARDDALDDALANTFPASDPISPGAPHRSTRADEERIAEHLAGRGGKERNK